MRTIPEETFVGLLVEALSNNNEAARELAQETAIKMAGGFTEDRLTELMKGFSEKYLEGK
jgi:hypothetical protein